MSDTLMARSAYRHFLTIPTRWMDNDIYRHVNNILYYSYFDTVINSFLIHKAGLNIHTGEVIGVAAESFCCYHRPLAFPDQVDAALRTARVGTISVRYEIGLFPAGSDDAAATGHFVHVFVDRATMRPVPMPPAFRAALEGLLVSA